MTKFEVQEMSCGHCVKAVTEAVKGVDPAASVDVDLKSKTVSVESDALVETLFRAINDAGYEVKTVN
ncbi:heavy-metal-associated domain-containing protein [Flaviflagellibacter deserti]|uniref:Heavy-metal-associated domain-containing protein n=1 Tax=Flaviflagellibacter deserti TaxID=2267266 RepID=A0ABV9Z6V7_9HYPH